MQQPSVILSNHDTTGLHWKLRVRAALVHLAASAGIALVVGILVFALWYPSPYGQISGGRDLFLLVIAVDVVLGPLLTGAVFNSRKPRAELRRDIAAIVLLQLAALGYGLWTVQLARPVHLVFEIDRFRVVHGSDIPLELEGRAPAIVERSPWKGPTVLSIRDFSSNAEKLEFTMAAIQGVHLAARPDLWEPYSAGRDRILAAAKPVAELKLRFAQRHEEIDGTLRRIGRESADVLYLPLISRTAEGWTVLLDARTAEIVGFLPLDSF